MKNLQHIKNPWYLERIREQGLRMGDELVVKPFNQRGRKLQLKRRVYRLSPGAGDGGRGEIKLPQVMEREFNLELRLVPDGANLDAGRYLLLAHSGTPFKINGTFCYQAIMERGDQVEFGLHQMLLPRNIALLDDLEIPENVVTSDLPIFIGGETGTGKSYLAQKIYNLSQQAGRFVPLNLSAFSQSLFESELFGHVKGAFTGAHRNKPGALVEANGGTLFIDEMDSLPRELQVKLLLFLDNGQVRAVGGDCFRQVNTRLIIACCGDLEDLVRRGDFRQDLFFRIQTGYKIALQPLRHDQKRIRAICEQFALAEDICFSTQLFDFYQGSQWPGNVRQLLGHLKTKKVLSPKRKWELDDFDYSLQNCWKLEARDFAGKFLELTAVKKNYARQVFEHTGRDIRLGAKILNISPTTFRGYVRESC